MCISRYFVKTDRPLDEVEEWFREISMAAISP